MCILALMNMSYVPVAIGKEGKLEFASQSQELFKCQGVNFTDRITMQLHPRLGEQPFDLFPSIVVDWLYLLHVLHTIVNGYFPVFRNPSYSVFLAHPLTPEDIAKNNKENTLSCPTFMSCLKARPEHFQNFTFKRDVCLILELKELSLSTEHGMLLSHLVEMVLEWLSTICGSCDWTTGYCCRWRGEIFDQRRWQKHDWMECCASLFHSYQNSWHTGQKREN